LNRPRLLRHFHLVASAAFLLLTQHAFGQIDSLDRVIRSVAHDSIRVRLCNEYSASLVNQNVNQGMAYAVRAIGYAQKLGDKKGEAYGLVNLGYANYYSGNTDTALILYQKAMTLAREAGDSLDVVRACNRIAFSYREQGNAAEALRYYNMALAGNPNEMFRAEAAFTYLNIGLLYHDQDKFADALKNELKGLEIYREINDESKIANAYARLGNLSIDQGDTAKGTEYYQKALDLFSKNNHLRGVAICLNNLAAIYGGRKDYKTELYYYLRAQEIREKIGDKNGVALVCGNIGSTYMKMGNYEKANEYYHKSLALAKKIDYKDILQLASLNLSVLFDTLHQPDSALFYYRLYHATYDSINSEASRRQVNELNAEFEKAGRDKEILALQRESELQNTRNWVMGIGLLLLCILIAVVWRNAERSKKANVILETQKTEIAAKNRIVEEQHRDMLDSINYAQRIQEAILPRDEERLRLFPSSFVFFRPRDIVSGDFWWMSMSGGVKLIAVADCTGHGVPGAFMSMIGNTLLNEIVNEKKITDPGIILNQLSQGITAALRQHEDADNSPDNFSTTSIVKDGMDISLCAFDETAGMLFFAGANNPLLYRSGDQLFELKGDRQPIGFFAADKKPFNVQVVPLKDVDAVYLFSDGYADQFGGENAKKFKISRLKELLLSLKDQTAEQQVKVVEKNFFDWKGNLEQVDDVLLIGIKIR
jgi:tetratricopeptide (TPR) repeat protein